MFEFYAEELESRDHYPSSNPWDSRDKDPMELLGGVTSSFGSDTFIPEWLTLDENVYNTYDEAGKRCIVWYIKA